MALALAATTLAASGCPRRPRGAPVTAEDETLQRSESDLIGERGALQRERKKLIDARTELAQKRVTAARDPAGLAALEAEEKELLEREQKLTSAEAQLDTKLDTLLRQRGELTKRAGEGGDDPGERAARRELGAAARERDVAEREKGLAGRERELAEREARVARREQEGCPAPAPVVLAPPPKGLHYGAGDVEPIYKKALKLMQEHGLLSSDLPPGAAKLLEETREAMKKADYVRARYDAEQLLHVVEGIRIDRSFISAKMARLSAAMRGKKLEGNERKAVDDLFQEATANYGDGKFPQANSKINRLFALLKAG